MDALCHIGLGLGAYVAAGSAITSDVAEGALAIGRARQVEKPGRAVPMREARRAAKAARERQGSG